MAAVSLLDDLPVDMLRLIRQTAVEDGAAAAALAMSMVNRFWSLHLPFDVATSVSKFQMISQCAQRGYFSLIVWIMEKYPKECNPNRAPLVFVQRPRRLF